MGQGVGHRAYIALACGMGCKDPERGYRASTFHVVLHTLGGRQVGLWIGVLCYVGCHIILPYHPFPSTHHLQYQKSGIAPMLSTDNDELSRTIVAM